MTAALMRDQIRETFLPCWKSTSMPGMKKSLLKSQKAHQASAYLQFQ